MTWQGPTSFICSSFILLAATSEGLSFWLWLKAYLIMSQNILERQPLRLLSQR